MTEEIDARGNDNKPCHDMGIWNALEERAFYQGLCNAGSAEDCCRAIALEVNKPLHHVTAFYSHIRTLYLAMCNKMNPLIYPSSFSDSALHRALVRNYETRVAQGARASQLGKRAISPLKAAKSTGEALRLPVHGGVQKKKSPTTKAKVVPKLNLVQHLKSTVVTSTAIPSQTQTMTTVDPVPTVNAASKLMPGVNGGVQKKKAPATKAKVMPKLKLVQHLKPVENASTAIPSQKQGMATVDPVPTVHTASKLMPGVNGGVQKMESPIKTRKGTLKGALNNFFDDKLTPVLAPVRAGDTDIKAAILVQKQGMATVDPVPTVHTASKLMPGVKGGVQKKKAPAKKNKAAPKMSIRSQQAPVKSFGTLHSFLGEKLSATPAPRAAANTDTKAAIPAQTQVITTGDPVPAFHTASKLMPGVNGGVQKKKAPATKANVMPKLVQQQASGRPPRFALPMQFQVPVPPRPQVLHPVWPHSAFFPYMSMMPFTAGMLMHHYWKPPQQHQGHLAAAAIPPPFAFPVTQQQQQQAPTNMNAMPVACQAPGKHAAKEKQQAPTNVNAAPVASQVPGKQALKEKQQAPTDVNAEPVACQAPGKQAPKEKQQAPTDVNAAPVACQAPGKQSPKEKQQQQQQQQEERGNDLRLEAWACLSPPASFKLPPDFNNLTASIIAHEGGQSLLPTSFAEIFEKMPKSSVELPPLDANVMRQGVEALYQHVMTGGCADATANSLPHDASLISLEAGGRHIFGGNSNSNWLAPFEAGQNGSAPTADAGATRHFAALFGQ